MAFKRKRVYAPRSSGRAYKKRRFSRRRRSARTVGYTSQKGAVTSFGFSRKKKIPLRVFKRKLWNATVDAPHYRSYAASSNTLSTGTTQYSQIPSRHDTLNVTTSYFWTSSYGAKDPDGGSVPTFKNDITVRGGKIGCTISTISSNTDTVQVRLWLIKLGQNPDFTDFPTGDPAGQRDISWDPTTIPDFSSKIGRYVMFKEALLEPGQAMTVEKRLGVMKIDQVAFAAGSYRYQWITHIVNVTSGSDVSVDFVRFHNLSFSADAQ